LQEKVLGTVEEATSAVRETVTNVKETMQEGVESVKEAVDVPAHVEKRPWLMFGGAMLGGFLLMTALTRDRIAAAVPRRMAVPTPPPTPKRHTPGNGHHKTQTAPAAAPQESIADKASSLLSAFEPEVNRLKSLALGMALGTVRELLTKDAPPHLADQLRGVIDQMTRKFGGEPVPAADIPFLSQPATQHATAETSPFDVEKPRW